MSRSLPPLETVAGDALIGSDVATFSPSPARQPPASSSTAHWPNNNTNMEEEEENMEVDESMPLLPGRKPGKKPFYRARPLWLVPFAITASLVRGMTLAPRVEVFTQLSCNRLHGDHNWNHTQATTPYQDGQLSLYSSLDPLGPHLHTSTSVIFNPKYSSTPSFTLPDPSSHSQDDQDQRDSDDTEDPRRIPSARCLGDPAVQAGAARIQTIMTTTMGLLSALTTGWWGHFGERHGRTRVLAISTLGLFLTDLTFILVSTPGSPLSKHGHNLLLLAPIIEGGLGGWSTLQSATSAYLSDCTSPGSRAHIFSRFQGVFYLGFALGPSIGGYLIQHPIKVISGGDNRSGITGGKMVTSVFWVAVCCSFVNMLLTLFVFPESLGKKKREQAVAAAAKGKAKASSPLLIEGGEQPEASSSASEAASSGGGGIITRFLSPLSVFLPVVVLDPSPYGIGHRKRRDWSLTMLAVALFGFMLSTGVFQIKYLYAVHTYGWGAEQLSYYISFMGGGRAVWLLFVLPTLIGFFKPKRAPPPTAVNNENGQPVAPAKKPKPTRVELGQEIKFDLALTRCSLFMDILSHSLVAILPAPGLKEHISSQIKVQGGDASYAQSQAMFVMASSLNSMGSGAVPAIHSLALCMTQVRALDARGQQEEDVNRVQDGEEKEEGTGTLFGALAVLQAVGQMILGPMLFGLIYSGTVAQFPKAIFVVAAGIMVFALTIVMCVRNPVRLPPSSSGAPARLGNGSGNGKKKRKNGDMERGRSRVSKDLRGGAVAYPNYGLVGSPYGATTERDGSV